jgi:hypothetical protein
MTRARYFQCMAVFEWFQTVGRSPDLEALYGMLNEMWQEDRKGCDAEQLAAYSVAWTSEDIEQDSQFQAFMREMNEAFRGRQTIERVSSGAGEMGALHREILKLLTEHGRMHWGDIRNKLNGQPAGWDVSDRDVHGALDSLLEARHVNRDGDRWTIANERYWN